MDVVLCCTVDVNMLEIPDFFDQLFLSIPNVHHRGVCKDD